MAKPKNIDEEDFEEVPKKNYPYEKVKLSEVDLEKMGELVKAGWTDLEVAAFFNITDRTLRRYRTKSEVFAGKFEAWKAIAVHSLEDALYSQAIGGRIVRTTKTVKKTDDEEVTIIEQVLPPNVHAITKLLHNWSRSSWGREKDNSEVLVESLTDEQLSRLRDSFKNAIDT